MHDFCRVSIKICEIVMFRTGLRKLFTEIVSQSLVWLHLVTSLLGHHHKIEALALLSVYLLFN